MLVAAYSFVQSARVVAAESRRYARNPRVPERHTVAMWLRLATSGKVLTTLDGCTLRVVQPGVLNIHDGPDFLEAEIILDGSVVSGAIEIHTDADDWWRHGHDKDPAYTGVILHVALYPPTRQAVLPPTVVLAGQLDLPFREAWEEVLHDDHPMHCAWRRSVEAHPQVDIMLLFAALRRYERKCERFRVRYAALLDKGESRLHALQQMLWEAVARAAGYGGNHDRMEYAAKTLPLQQILAFPHHRRAEMLLAAGLTMPKSVSGRAESTWLKSAVIPSNRAGARMRWLAAWSERLSSEQWLKEVITNSLSFTDDAMVFATLFRIKDVKASPGPDRVIELTVNVIAPLLNLLAELRDDSVLRRRAASVYLSVRSAPQNRITRIVAPVLGLTAPFSSQMQQGMIELFTGFCQASKCAACMLSD